MQGEPLVGLWSKPSMGLVCTVVKSQDCVKVEWVLYGRVDRCLDGLSERINRSAMAERPDLNSFWWFRMSGRS